jgi:hypothetical protein
MNWVECLSESKLREHSSTWRVVLPRLRVEHRFQYSAGASSGRRWLHMPEVRRIKSSRRAILRNMWSRDGTNGPRQGRDPTFP